MSYLFDTADLISKSSVADDAYIVFDLVSGDDIRLSADKTIRKYRRQPEQTFTEYVMLTATQFFLTDMLKRVGLHEKYKVELLYRDYNKQLYLRIILAQW